MSQRILRNDYYARRNHIRLAKGEVTKRTLSNEAVARAQSLGASISDSLIPFDVNFEVLRATRQIRLFLSTVDASETVPNIEIKTLLRSGASDIVQLADAALSPQLAVDTSNIVISGSNRVVSLASGSFTNGRLYRMGYRLADNNLTQFFPGNPSPFPPPNPAYVRTQGPHVRFITADSNLAPGQGIVRASAPVESPSTFTEFSVHLAEWLYDIPANSNNELIEMLLEYGSAQEALKSFTPDKTQIFVSKSGGRYGTGSISAPIRDEQAAADSAQPGDKVIFRKGEYNPITINVSGTPGNRIEFITLDKERRQAVIAGDLEGNVLYGGQGVPATGDNIANRDAIYVPAQQHLRFKGLVLRSVWRTGLFIVGGAQGVTYRDFLIQDLEIKRLGTSAINFTGQNSDTVTTLGDIINRVTEGRIEDTVITETNLPTDERPEGANVESISAGALASDLVVTRCTIFNTDQYGVDFKAGFENGEISFCEIYDVEIHAIYLDAGRRWVRNVDVFNNVIYRCRTGVALAREAGEVGKTYEQSKLDLGAAEFIQELSNIRVYNNYAYDLEEGGFFPQDHPRDSPLDGTIDGITQVNNTWHNGNRIGTARDANWFKWGVDSAAVTMNVLFARNLISNEENNVQFRDDPSAGPYTGITYRDNYDQNVDPGYVNADGSTPDFRPDTTKNSPLVGNVSEVLTAPFDEDFLGVTREATSSSGAFEPLGGGEVVAPPPSGPTFGDSVSGDIASGTTVGTAAVIGVVPSPNWIQYDGGVAGDFTAFNLENQDGTPTTLDLSLIGANTNSNSRSTGTGDLQNMFLRGVQVINGTILSITECPYARYDVIIYYDEKTNSSSRGTGEPQNSITDGVTTYYYTTNASPNFTGTLIRSEVTVDQTADGNDGNYWLFEGLSGDTTFTFPTPIGSARINLTGIQIVERTDL